MTPHTGTVRQSAKTVPDTYTVLVDKRSKIRWLSVPCITTAIDLSDTIYLAYQLTNVPMVNNIYLRTYISYIFSELI
jgi:hypothetical protein